MALSLALSQWSSYILNWDTDIVNTSTQCLLKDEPCYSPVYKENMTLSSTPLWPELSSMTSTLLSRGGEILSSILLKKKEKTGEQTAQLCNFSSRKSSFWVFFFILWSLKIYKNQCSDLLGLTYCPQNESQLQHSTGFSGWFCHRIQAFMKIFSTIYTPFLAILTGLLLQLPSASCWKQEANFSHLFLSILLLVIFEYLIPIYFDKLDID